MKSDRLHPTVWVLGFVSLCNDVASEMVYPLVPIFLTTILGAPVIIVGLVEGAGELLANILKLVAGIWSDKIRQRKRFISIGYALPAITKLLYAMASIWPIVLVGRVVDRIGKGLRTTPRDALIVQATAPAQRGQAFGVHRTLDSMGAVVGPVLALLLMWWLQDNFRIVFLLAVLPSLVGLFLLQRYIHEPTIKPVKVNKPQLTLKQLLAWNQYGSAYKIFLIISVIFALGNSADAFLLLRAQQLTNVISATVLFYVLYNVTYALFSTPAGVLADRFGSKRVLIVGQIIFALVYFAFAWVTASVWLWVLFPVYGCYMALTDGVGKAYISKLVPTEQVASALGLYISMVGVATFLASLFGGWLWTIGLETWTFNLGGIMSLLATILFVGHILYLRYNRVSYPPTTVDSI